MEIRCPRHPAALWILGLALAASGGTRQLDRVFLDQEVHLVEGRPFGDLNGVLAGGLISPVFLVPIMFLLLKIGLRNYPKEPIPINYFTRTPNRSQVGWNFLFGGLAMVWGFFFCSQIRLIQKLTQYDLAEFVPDALWNLVCIFCTLILWLALRAVSCFRARGAIA